jgi:hypothetical protein
MAFIYQSNPPNNGNRTQGGKQGGKIERMNNQTSPMKFVTYFLNQEYVKLGEIA